MQDAARGFQRIVDQDRAKDIADQIIASHLSFPNAIVLASLTQDLDEENGDLIFPPSIKFLVVDGQHRLWAQKYTGVEAQYPVELHMGLTEKQMAQLFLDINDKQKRVPSSLRWDLYRLVKPEDDPFRATASEIVFALIDREGTALFQRVDRTGEQKALKLKFGSIAPEIHDLIGSSHLPLRNLPFSEQVAVFETYFAAIRDLNADDWDSGKSTFYKARVLRAVLRLLGDILRREKRPLTTLTIGDYEAYLEKIKVANLTDERIRAQQGAAGVKAIYDTIKKDVFPS